MTATTTTTPATVDLSVPIWTIDHVAAALHLSVDTAREYTYLVDFPAPKAGFSRSLWLCEEVLDWFSRRPNRPASGRHRAHQRLRGRSP